MDESAESSTGYELLDVGVRRRLEGFGAVTIDRPAPGAEAFRLAPEAWAATDLRFDPGPGWSGPAWPAEPWTIEISGLRMELRPTSSGGLGLYPEHAANLPWLEAQVGRLVAAPTPTAGTSPTPAPPASVPRPAVLNLFAHTGLATLALARAGASVVHVDGARSAVAWARRNAELSGLVDRPVRWIVDDAVAFVEREARRARRYDGIVLDPPAFGRASGRAWRLETELPALLAGCAAIAAPRAFVLLTAHSPALDGRALANALVAAFPGRATDTAKLALTASSSATLNLGWAARVSARWFG